MHYPGLVEKQKPSLSLDKRSDGNKLVEPGLRYSASLEPLAYAVAKVDKARASVSLSTRCPCIKFGSIGT